VRGLARDLAVSPATVAAAYRTLRQRGLVKANGRRGTVVTNRPTLLPRPGRSLPPNTRDLARGNPDPALLPPLGPVLRRLDTRHTLYGEPAKLERLVELARADFARDGVTGELAIAGGALDGIERALQSRLHPGDRVVVEDPTWPRITDLVHALALEPEPVPVDDAGLDPEALEHALERGAAAVILTPRGQNPTGAALDSGRAEELRAVLSRHRDVLLIEDDYVAAVAGAPYVGLAGATEHWTTVRSVSKVLGPDLRIAPMAGDPLTIGRIEGRQLVGAGWVSHLLQQTAAELWTATATKKLLARAERTYAERRSALVEALASHGIDAHGGSGLGVWVPVAEEVPVVQRLLELGWAVSAGERYRFRTSPGIRITTTTLETTEAEELATAFEESLQSAAETYAG
jgi:DNA-binding transcriptional MocR family regulator